MHNFGADYTYNPGWRMLNTLTRLKVYGGAVARADDIVSYWIELEMGVRIKHGPFGKKYDV